MTIVLQEHPVNNACMRRRKPRATPDFRAVVSALIFGAACVCRVERQEKEKHEEAIEI